MSTKKSVKCKICGKKYVSKAALIEHLGKAHSSSIPKDWSPARFENYLRTGKTEGHCVYCKKETTWNETTGKYNRMCGSEACKKKARELANKNYIGVHGKPYSINDPEQQKKMIYGRKNSGTYIFEDEDTGKKYKAMYDSSYGKDFLEMIDTFLNWDGADIIAPSPNTYWYEYEGKKHFYIPDVYSTSLNLEIELKDGGNNPNNHPKIQAVDKVKEEKKDAVMKSLKDQVNYIKICNKDYTEFFALLSRLKEKDVCQLPKWQSRLESITESYVTEEVDIAKSFSYYHLEEKKKDYSWDEEQYYKTIDDSIKSELYNLANSESGKKEGKQSFYVYTMGKEYKSICLGKIMVRWFDFYDKNNPKYDYEWEETFDIDKSLIDEEINPVTESSPLNPVVYIKRNHKLNHPMLNYDDLIGYYRKQLFHKRLKPLEWQALYNELIGVKEYLQRVSNETGRPDNRMAYESRKALKEIEGFIQYMEQKNEDIVIESNIDTKPIYFLSTKNMNNRTLTPRIPDNYFTKNGFEDNRTKRVCFAPSIDKALMALSRKCTSEEFYVHIPNGKYDIYRPTIKEVPDSKITGELWITNPVKIKCIGKIKVIGDKGLDGHKFKYGDKEAELYDWVWKWVDKYGTSIMESTFNKSNKVPIYIVSWNYGSFVGNMVRLTTGSIYNHTSIALTSDLEDCYTFSRNPETTKSHSTNGFCRESLSYMVSRYGDCTIKVDAVYISKSNYKKLQKIINEYKKHESDTSFDYVNFARILFNIEKEELDENKLNCSVFTDLVLKKSGIDVTNGKSSNLVTPSDLSNLDKTNKNVVTVYTGLASEYNRDNIITESSLKSNIDKDFKSKGSKKLSQFKQKELTKSLIDKYKDSSKLLKHVDYTNDRCIGFFDGNKLVGYVCVNKESDGIIWITALEITNDYKGYGLGNQLLDYAVKSLHARALGVAKNNNVAYQMYEKYGFKTSKKSIDEVNQGKRNNYRMYYRDISESNYTIIKEETSTLDKNFKKKSGKHFEYKSLSTNVDKYFKDDQYWEKFGKYHKENSIGEIAIDKETGELAGYIFVKNKRSGEEGFITPLEVLPEYRGYGVSNKLVDDAIRKYGAVDLTVDIDNEVAINLYKKHGFVIIGYENEKTKKRYYMKLRSKLSKDETIISESTYIEGTKDNIKYYPVFIFLSYTGTNMAKLIKSFTHDPYAHSSISFDTELNHMVSFNREGMVEENINEKIWKKNKDRIKYSLYMYMASAEEYESMRNFVNELLGRRSKLRYNVLGLTNFVFGRGSEREDKYFCSEFVASVISAGNANIIKTRPYMTSPYMLAKNKNFKFIKKGILKNYDSKVVDNLVKDILEERGFEDVTIK